MTLAEEILDAITTKITVEKFQVESGDKVIIKIVDTIPPNVWKDIRDLAKKLFPDNQVLLVSEGITIGKSTE